jgi:multisubunit Na+/H+ antiporter MnhC subunit
MAAILVFFTRLAIQDHWQPDDDSYGTEGRGRHVNHRVGAEMDKTPPSPHKNRPPVAPDDVAIKFHCSMWWTNVMMGSLVALIVTVVLLGTAIADPLRQGVVVVAIVLTVCFSASLVMTAVTAAQLRHLAQRKNRGTPKAPRSISKRDLIVYVVALVWPRPSESRT